MTNDDDILYFSIKVAVQRIGGVAATARQLGVSRRVVRGWIERGPMGTAEVAALSSASGVSEASLLRYQGRLAAWREREGLALAA